MPSLNEISHVHDSKEEDFENDHFTTLYSSTLPKKALIIFQTSSWLTLPVQCNSEVSCLPTSDQKNFWLTYFIMGGGLLFLGGGGSASLTLGIT